MKSLPDSPKVQQESGCLEALSNRNSRFISTAFACFRYIVFFPRRMTNNIQTPLLCLTLLASALGSGQQSGIGYKPAADADSKKTILLKDFHPQTALHAAAHEVPRAKFPVI